MERGILARERESHRKRWGGKRSTTRPEGGVVMKSYDAKV
jgi:hypothetical protein